MSEENIDSIVHRVRDRLADEFMIETADIEALCVTAAQVAQLRAERDDLRTIVTRLQDDILHKDETLALVERDRPVEAAFTLAKVMRECREANRQIAALQAERDEARAQRDELNFTLHAEERPNRTTIRLLRAALVEVSHDCGRDACCIVAHKDRIAALRSAAEGESE